MPPTARRRLALAALAALVACAGGEPRPDTPRAEPLDWPGFERVSREGDVLFAGQPDEEGFARAASEGVRVVVNLRRAEEVAELGFDEAEVVAAHGMTYVHVPVDPATFSADEAARIDAALAGADGPVLIHCGSSNRVGGAWTVHLAREGVDREEALARGRAAGLRKPGMETAVERVLASEDGGAGR